MNKTIIETANGKITMRAPKVRDIRAISHMDNDDDREFALFCNLTGMVQSDLDDMDLVDYGKLQKAYENFTLSPTGDNV